MSDKPFKEKDWADKVLPIGVIAILVVVLVMGFFVKQTCDIDEQYLWCKFHPANGWTVFGYLLFNAGGLLLSGVWQKWFTLYNEAHKITWNIISFVAMVAGMLIVWFL